MSPQVFLSQRYTNKADVWSAGVLFLYMMTLLRPKIQQFEFKPIDPNEIPISDKRLDDLRQCICTMMIVDDEAKRSSVAQIVALRSFRKFYDKVDKQASEWQDDDKNKPSSDNASSGTSPPKPIDKADQKPKSKPDVAAKDEATVKV